MRCRRSLELAPGAECIPALRQALRHDVSRSTPLSHFPKEHQSGGSFSQKEHQNGLKLAIARRRRRFSPPKCFLYTKQNVAPRRGLGAVGCAVLFAVRICKVRRRNTHTAHQTPDATGFYATSLSAPVTHAFIKIERAPSATSPAKHSSPRAYRVRGKAIDAPHGNGSREHAGHSA